VPTTLLEISYLTKICLQPIYKPHSPTSGKRNYHLSAALPV